MKYYHIMIDSIYSRDYIERINSLYEEQEHAFFVSQWDGKRIYTGNNIIICKKVSTIHILRMVMQIYKAQKVILHSLFLDKKEFVIIAVLSGFVKKFMWYIWSADLYQEYYNFHSGVKLSIQARIKERCRKKIIFNLKAIIVFCKKDYENAITWYQTKAKMFLAEYTYYFQENLYNLEEKKENQLVILVGHSAYKGNMHKNMLESLSKYAGEDILLYTPLSYPNDKEYVEAIIKKGKDLFGEKFIPLTDWMPIEEYQAILKRIDIAIIGCEVQGGAGNLMNLFYLGKKVYLSHKNGLFEKFREEGIICFDIMDLSDAVSFFKPLTLECKKNNHEIIKRISSEKSFKKRWDCVFGS